MVQEAGFQFQIALPMSLPEAPSSPVGMAIGDVYTGTHQRHACHGPQTRRSPDSSEPSHQDPVNLLLDQLQKPNNLKSTNEHPGCGHLLKTFLHKLGQKMLLSRLLFPPSLCSWCFEPQMSMYWYEI